MKRIAVVIAAVGVAAVIGASIQLDARQGAGRLTADAMKGIEFRSLGPTLSTGRVADITVDPNHPDVYYVASAVGGLWKSENRGNTWTSLFDNGGAFNMCCVVVDPKNSDIVWLGTGENSVPRSATYGDGLYKSTDGCKTWTRSGLATSEHLGRIVIDPRNSDVVYVASQGPLWAAGGDRGVFKTTDGGKTWKAVLTVSPDTGANDVVMDPTNSDILYASTWQRRRAPGQMIGGGPESGIFKSVNAGGTWTKLTKGLPEGDLGRIALGVDPKARPTRVYALINGLAGESGFFRSDDAGVNFMRMGAPYGKPGAPVTAAAAPAAARGSAGAAGGGAGGPGAAGGRGGRGGCAPGAYCGGDPGYYQEIFVDPIRPDTIWSANTNLEWSRDGGASWSNVTAAPGKVGPNLRDVHVDFHAVWADPKDKTHIMVGNDGGAYESWDEGQTWRHFDNLPITQFYRVAADDALPFYNVCAGAQDNESQCGPTRTANSVGIRLSDWWMTGGCDGFFSRIEPGNPNIVYLSCQSGSVSRVDLRTGETKNIQPRPQAPPGGAGAAGAQGGGRGGRGGDRVNWDAPYIISPHSPTRLYWASDKIYRTDDRGDHWEAVSGDLTRNLDARTIPIMGKVWDPATTVAYNNATTVLSTIVSLDESPLMEGLIYAGTDDGLIQVTEDGGKNWRKTEHFAGVPDNVWVTSVFASRRDANVVFATLNNWQRGDFKPYVVRSDDRGKTFKSIVGDFPDRMGTWSIVQDQVNPNLMFVGAEYGLFATIDGGSHWVQMKGGLPVAAVRDIAVQTRENDLVLATFGRGLYVYDDYSALRDLTPETLGQEAALLPLRRAFQFNENGLPKAAWGNYTTPNPPDGATFTYYVSSSSIGPLALKIDDEAGKQVRRLNVTSTEPGLHRMTWDLREEPPVGGGRGGRGGGGGAGAAGAGAPVGAAGGARAAAGAGARGAGAPAGAARGAAGAPVIDPAALAAMQAAQGGGGFGRGGGRGAFVPLGRYTATLCKVNGDQLTPIGKGQTVLVVSLPAKNW